MNQPAALYSACRKTSSLSGSGHKLPQKPLGNRLRKAPPDTDWVLALPFDELDVAAVDKRGGATSGDLARLADEEVDRDALGFVAADEAAVGVVAAGAVLALPLEEGGGEEVVPEEDVTRAHHEAGSS